MARLRTMGNERGGWSDVNVGRAAPLTFGHDGNFPAAGHSNKWCRAALVSQLGARRAHTLPHVGPCACPVSGGVACRGCGASATAQPGASSQSFSAGRAARRLCGSLQPSGTRSAAGSWVQAVRRSGAAVAQNRAATRLRYRTLQARYAARREWGHALVLHLLVCPRFQPETPSSLTGSNFSGYGLASDIGIQPTASAQCAALKRLEAALQALIMGF